MRLALSPLTAPLGGLPYLPLISAVVQKPPIFRECSDKKLSLFSYAVPPNSVLLSYDILTQVDWPKHAD